MKRGGAKPKRKSAAASKPPKPPRLIPVKERGVLEPVPHRGPVQALGVSPDGAWAMTGGKDGLVRVFDVHKGSCSAEWQAHEGGVWALCALDGRRVATAGHDHTVKVWEVARGTCLMILRGHEDFVYRLAPLAGGNALASAGADRVIRVWDLEKKLCIRELTGHSRLVSALAPVGTMQLLSASADQSLRLWNLETGTCLRALTGHRQDVLQISVSPDGARAVSTCADGELRLWELSTGQCLASARAHDGSAECVRIGAGGALLSGGWDGRVRWWTSALRATRQVKAHHGAVKGLDAAPRSRHLFTGGADAVVRALEAKSGRAVSRWAGPAPVTALAAVDASGVLVGFASGEVVLLRLAAPPKAKR